MRTKKPAAIHNRTTQEIASISTADAQLRASHDVAFHNKPTMLLSTVSQLATQTEADSDDASSVDDLVDLLRERDELRAALAKKEEALAQATQALADKDAELERVMLWLPTEGATAAGVSSADVLEESERLRKLVLVLQRPADQRTDREKLRWLLMEVALVATSLKRLCESNGKPS